MNINCNGNLIDLSTPKVMGILNVTPNSFYDGGKHKEINSIIHQVDKMLSEGADFIDIGAYSSKPSAEFVSEEEEIKRLVHIIKELVETFPTIILSVDTFRANVARASVENGVAMVNDISAGLLDDKMLETVADIKVPYIMMHMRGNPQTMQSLTHYEDIVKEMTANTPRPIISPASIRTKARPSSETAGLRPRICGTHQQARARASSTTRQAISNP